MSHLDKIREVYNYERNAEISWFWDGGFRVKVGDPINGFTDEGHCFETIEQAIDWLHTMVLGSS